MNILQKRIENLCDEIIGRILALMKVNSVSEVILTDNDNPVYVIWFDKIGDPCHEAALANPVWLNDILEAITNIFHIKEDNVICCKCGSTNVTCEAMINPNTKDFDHYTDDSFQYGWCDNCKTGTVISDTSEVKKGISQKYKEFTETYNTEPQLALCRIIWKDDMKETEVSIALENIPEEHDDAIFFYCDSLSDFMALAEYGGEDFIVTECFNFTNLENEE